MRFPVLFLLIPLSLLGQTKLTLPDALDQAEKLNPSVQQAHLRVLESQAQLGVTKSAYQPQIQGVVTGTYATNNFQGIGLAFPGFPSRVGPYRTFNARPAATQTIIDLSLISDIRAARERAKTAENQQEVTKEETLLAVLQLYLQALQAESRVTAADARMKTSEAVLTQTRDLESSGAASKLDIARAEQQLETDRGLRITAQQDRDVIVSLLLETIGLEPAPEAVALEAPARKEGAGSSLERAELRVAAAQVRTGELEKQAARREYLPKLQGFGDFGVLGVGPDRSLSTYQIGAQVTFPIWTGRRIESEIAAAQARISIAEQELRRAKLRIAQELRQARIELDATTQATTAAEKAAAAARTTVELARLRFAAGLATNIDTIVAQGRLAEAEDEEIRTRYAHQLARAKLARAQGNVRGFLE